MAKIAVLLLVAALAFGAIAKADELIAVDAANPPFMYDAGGKAAGVYPALITEAYRRMGIPVTITALPWKRAIESIDAGEGGVGGIYKNTARLQKYDYSEKLFEEVLQIYVRKGHAFSYTGIDSLNSRLIGVIRGWSYGDEFDAARKLDKVKVEDATGDAQNFAKLLANRIDAVIAIKEAGAAAIASSGSTDEIEALPMVFSNNPAYLAFNKSAGKMPELQTFDDVIAEMRRDGTFAKILSSVL